MRSIPLVVTNTGKRVMDLDVHYRQVLNNRITNVGRSTNGWFTGGEIELNGVGPTRLVSTVDRIIFTNDVTTATVRGSLTTVRSYMGGTGNTSDGWIGGGWIGGAVISSVDRISFQQDGSVTLSRGSLSSSRGGVSAVGNVSDGWYTGGYDSSFNSLSTVDRITFSADL